MEIWKEIPDLPKIYLASNFGNIKRIEVEYLCKVNGKFIKFKLKEEILSCKKPTKKGYLRVSLKINESLNSKTKQYFIHRLVAAAFLGKTNLQVNHKNGIKTDNKLENLEYVTNKENRDHAVKNNLIANRSNGFCKFTFEQIKEIKNLRNLGYKQKEIASIFKTKQQTISYLLRIKNSSS